MGVLDDLTRPATGDDTVGGVPARLVAAPESTEQAAALIAAARDLTVVIRGAGTRLDTGPPPRTLDLIIDTRRLTGIVEHAAGDLIAVVRAGTTLGELQGALAGHHQRLALDGPDEATVGGTVAANVSGPRRLLYGTARDLVIGMTVVRPDGRIAHTGGKVVKNVAGYDLGKLYTGSYGTLGLITECTFRLHPRPPAARYVRAVAPASDVARILDAQVVATAIELDRPAGGPCELAVLVEGTPTGVRERAGILQKILGGEISEQAPPWWGADPWPDGGIALKLSVPLSAVPSLLEPSLLEPESGLLEPSLLEPGVLEPGAGVAVRGSAGSGVLYASVGDAAGVERIRAACIRAGGHAVVLTAPPQVRDRLDMWGPVPGLDLMRRIKDQFDPGHRFAPGRFVGGI